jgi:hypothetical protein
MLFPCRYVRIYELLVINMRGLQYCPPAPPLHHTKTLYKKSKRIWKTTFERNSSFPGPHRKRKKLETGSMAVGANSSLVVVGKRG